LTYPRLKTSKSWSPKAIPHPQFINFNWNELFSRYIARIIGSDIAE
jgi:hypothetical protein